MTTDDMRLESLEEPIQTMKRLIRMAENKVTKGRDTDRPSDKPTP